MEEKIKTIIKKHFIYCNCFGSEYGYSASVGDATNEILALIKASQVEAPVILQTAEEMEKEFKNKFIQFYSNGDFDWSNNPIEVLLWIKRKFYNASSLSK